MLYRMEMELSPDKCHSARESIQTSGKFHDLRATKNLSLPDHGNITLHNMVTKS